MSETERRPGAAETSAAAADDARFTLLTTARDNAEGAFIESVLRGENIPYITRPHSRESWNRVMMGFDLAASTFSCPRISLTTRLLCLPLRMMRRSAPTPTTEKTNNVRIQRNTALQVR